MKKLESVISDWLPPSLENVPASAKMTRVFFYCFFGFFLARGTKIGCEIQVGPALIEYGLSEFLKQEKFLQEVFFSYLLG